jgi:NAD(P)-dependent dehydrogenase (short-subunit alcohol dehydrogenase family)
VTGGARGIGRSVCKTLAEAGTRICVADLSAAACEEACATLPGEGHVAICMDVTDQASVASGFAAVEEQFGGPVTVLVACAGVLLFKPDGERPLVTETELADWQRTLTVNLTGCFLSLRDYARRAPDPHPAGRIITVSSSAAQLGGYRSSAAYIASKAGVLGLTKAMARELAPRGVTVNAVAPGLIDAPMLRLSLDPAKDAQAAANIPLNRIGQPEDVAAAVRYLASAEASYLTGVTLDVNGGYRMQ